MFQPVDVRRVVFMLAVASIMPIVFFTARVAETNPASRYATMDALVHDGTFAINNSVYSWTIDKVSLDGKLYSSKPPLLSTVGAGVYFLLNKTFRLSFRDDSRRLAVYCMNLILALGPHLILLFYFYRLIGMFTKDALITVVMFAVIAFGYLGVGYATSLNNHTLAATAVLVAFYYAYSLRAGFSDRRRDWVLAGVAAGLAPTLDFGAAFISFAIGIYLLSFDLRRTVTYFGIAAIPPMATHFALTYAISGGIAPIYLRPELYHYAGSFWNAPIGFDGLNEPKHIYLFNILLGHHGLFSMTPLLLLAMIGLGLACRRQSPTPPAKRAAAVLVGACLVTFIVFYTATTRNYGGWCVGFRWFIPIMPLTLLFVTDYLSHFRERQAAFAIFVVFFAIGQLHAVNALQSPWYPSFWHRQLDPMARVNVRCDDEGRVGR